ncbi:MFS transporter [Salinicola endophyticus]|uniref:MFS transporter n=1 Tax=Salinicola endophyticus TaxID=1949083 RepID=A0ABY8FKR5_9GAMM|nr:MULTISPECIES: MFS transporter [Salinicola]WFF43207.1 MFS transporter [Salinicola endophyticus]
MSRRPWLPIVVIALAEWFGTTLWFTPNAVLAELRQAWALDADDLAWLTGAVQVGFLLGTLGIGLSGLADRHDASRVFAFCGVIGAASNAALAYAGGLGPAVALRLITGMALAGIYPVGMKLMVGWAPTRTGAALAWLVGMLVLGTAMPHLLAALELRGGWQLTLWLASLLALIGAAGVAWLGEAPRSDPHPSRPRLGGLAAFRLAEFRRAACAYFGHMWELYTLWALLPLLLRHALPGLSATGVALSSFTLIAVGAPGCWLGGWLSQRHGSLAVARWGLAGSALCAALYALTAGILPTAALIALLGSWSLLAVIDSPHFSALSARACPASLVGSALTLQNAIGFAISALSIGLLLPWLPLLGQSLAWLLLPGPLLGLLALGRPR